MKFIFTTLFLVCLVLGSSFCDAASIAPAPQPTGAGNFCPRKCSYRCSKASAKGRCLKYCNICCNKCHCVPSGTYGHKDECPCYRDLKNSKGKGKCP